MPAAGAVHLIALAAQRLFCADVDVKTRPLALIQLALLASQLSHISQLRLRLTRRKVVHGHA
jgi:hypothetical protein